MRIVLFYSGVDSFNYFTNQINDELRKRKHETFVLDLTDSVAGPEHSYDVLEKFILQKVDMAICFDGFGIREEPLIHIWDTMNTVVVNILMVPPLRFHPIMKRHPKHYIQLSADRKHVDYVKKYFSKEVSNVGFMQHAGTLSSDTELVPFKERKYDILFSGTYDVPDYYINQVVEEWKDNPFILQFYTNVIESMLENSDLTTDEAVVTMVEKMAMEISNEGLLTLFRCAEKIDWIIRMDYRARIISVLANAGFDIWLLGNGWGNHPSAGLDNVHWIKTGVPFEETLSYITDVKINLNVMPWFKAGTHDRIFNILLRHSLPLTDSSEWIDDNFTDGKDIVLYDLKHLEKLPEIVEYWLNYEEKAEKVIENGYKKVAENFTWKNCVDQILGYYDEFGRIV